MHPTECIRRTNKSVRSMTISVVSHRIYWGESKDIVPFRAKLVKVRAKWGEKRKGFLFGCLPLKSVV